MDKGLLLTGPDETMLKMAKKDGVGCIVGEIPELPFEKTLIVAPGTRVPWHLLEAGWTLLDRWDAAVPLWQYTVTAETIGDQADRDRTLKVIRDLRVLLHATELVFVRANQPGRELAEKWATECGDPQDGGDPRLAFLRALYLVKPRLYVLPISWSGPDRAAPGVALRPFAEAKLTRVEISPGEFVKCRPGDENRVLEMLRRRRRG